jgi:predicted esterase
MRRLLLFLAMMVSLAMSTAGQTFKKQQFPVSASAKLWGVMYLPEGYGTDPSVTYPIMIFCHGVGEAGSSEAAAEALYSHGPLGFAKAGHRMEYTNPADGKQYRYILLALQAPAWSPSASQIAYCLNNEIFPKYKIDRTRVIITGLSAGGDVTLNAITTTGIAPLFTAAIPMSPASSGNTQNIAVTVAAGIRSWGFSGNNDGGFTSNLNAFSAKLNQVAPGAARVFIYVGGHGGWSTFYDPVYKSNLWGGSMNVYEFGLAASRGTTWVPAPPPSSAARAMFNMNDGDTVRASTFEIDGSASENVRTDWEGYLWGIKPVLGGSWGAQVAGGAYGGPKRNVINITNGTYELSLTVKTATGQTNTRTINFIAVLGGTTPPPPATKTITNVATKIEAGLIVVVISWSDGTTTTYK